jgi:hypothetical protein
VGRLVLIDGLLGAIAAGLLLTGWYLWFVHYNRRRGIQVLRRVQAACGGKGSVLEPRWCNSSLLQASLHLPSRWFEDAQLTVRLVPRPVPLRWLLSRWRKQKETLTFEADLDHHPDFQLDVMHHRWAGSSDGSSNARLRSWSITRPSPVVLTTRQEWSQELSPLVSALMSSREKNFLTVKFHPHSPNFTATVELDVLSDQKTAATLISTLRELASGASARQH